MKQGKLEAEVDKVLDDVGLSHREPVILAACIVYMGCKLIAHALTALHPGNIGCGTGPR